MASSYPVRAVQRNLHHQLLRSGVLITGSSRAGMPDARGPLREELAAAVKKSPGTPGAFLSLFAIIGCAQEKRPRRSGAVAQGVRRKRAFRSRIIRDAEDSSHKGVHQRAKRNRTSDTALVTAANIFANELGGTG